MEVLQPIILGLVQGITEFLPVSSSGHLIVVSQFFSWEDQGLLFDVAVHVATLLAVLIYFRKDVLIMAKAIVLPKQSTKQSITLAWFVVLSIIPVGILGVLLETNRQSNLVIAISFIVWGIVLGLADRYAKAQPALHAEEGMTWKRGLFIACAQAIALIPGTSRSGITMAAGLFAKFNKTASARIAMLMSIPTIAAAGLLQTKEALDLGIGAINWPPIMIGSIVAFLSAIFAIWGLLKVIQKWSYMPFVIYRIALGLLILVWFV